MFENNLNSEALFDLYETGYDPEQAVTTGSNYMFGNGYMGYRGTHPDATKEHFAACIVSDTYDTADGKWNELCNVPNGLFISLSINNNQLSGFSEDLNHYKRQIKLDTATLCNEFENDQVKVQVERFASLDQLHLLAMKYVITPKNQGDANLVSGIDGDVWSINGEHFQEFRVSKEADALLMHTVTKELGTDIYVAECTLIDGVPGTADSLESNEKQAFRKLSIKLSEGEPLIIEKFVAIYSGNDTEDPKSAALQDLHEAIQQGYQSAHDRHSLKWSELWNSYDIQIQGNDRDQTLTRFNLYHNIIHTPTHALLPVGARGLSCQAYQGAAFWDQEIFNLPMYLYTNPAIAKNILMYRYQTLEGARGKARKLGYRGAFYAWISGKTGAELCPDFFFKDVISGRKIRNHFNCWQIHVSPDIAYTIWRYYEVTGDKQFLQQYGAEMMLDISLFLMSRSFYNVDKQRYEFIRLLGPDEYHENVDNNVFTNYQARYVIEKTLDVVGQLKAERPDHLQQVLEKLDVSEEVLSTFEDMVRKIYVKVPNNDGVIEQFDGYFDLEDVRPEILKGRLIDKSEYWGWPNGVAVHTQVLKQADLIQLFVLHDDFDQELLKTNFDYYEPRTEHGSSLSPAMYSIIASKIGYRDMAYKYFVKSCTVDLYNTNKAVSGGTFIGGIHTASCGAVWQMLVFGFAGFSEHHDTLYFKPSLPKDWHQIRFKLHHRLNFVHVTIDREQIVLESAPENKDALSIDIAGNTRTLEPGQRLTTVNH